MTAVAYSLGTSKFDNYPSHRALPTLDEFFSIVLSARHEATPDDKARGRVPYFAPAFGPDERGLLRRCTEGALPRAWLGLDIDGLTPAAELVLTPLLARRRGVWYATMSASALDLRRRVLLALDRVATVVELPRVALAVEAWLMRAIPEGLRFDTAASSDVARLWYLPHRDADSGEFDGEPINVDRALAAAPEVPEGQPPAAVVPDADLRAHLASGVDVHDAVTRLAARLVGRGMDPDEVIAVITGMLDPLAGWALADPRRFRERVAEVPRAVQSAHRRFTRGVDGRPPPSLPAPVLAPAAVTEHEDPAATMFRYSHDSGAEEVWRQAADNLRFVTTNKRWAAWDGQRWDLDSRLAHDVVHRVSQQMANRAQNDPALTPAMRDNLARKCGSLEFRNGIRGVCEHDLASAVRPGNFDTDPFLLNTPEALLDLRTGVEVPHRRKYLVSKMTACSPVTDAHAGSRFARFLQEVTGGNYETESFLQRGLGACLFGKTATADAWLLFCVGSGRNGKSVLMEAVSYAMGSYAGKIPSNVLLAQEGNERHPTEIANLRGLRLAYAAEIDEGKRWHESRIKELTGDRAVTARVMRGDPFEFDLSHRFVIAANHRPTISNPDPALRARLRMVPFLQTFLGREEAGLYERLRDEAPIVLGWLMRGAGVFWSRQRLDGCEQSNAETEAYFALHSTLDTWVEERCVVDEYATTPTRELYRDFKKWKEDRGEGVPAQNRFSEQLGRDVRFNHVGGAFRGFRGIKLQFPEVAGSFFRNDAN